VDPTFQIAQLAVWSRRHLLYAWLVSILLSTGFS